MDILREVPGLPVDPSLFAPGISKQILRLYPEAAAILKDDAALKALLAEAYGVGVNLYNWPSDPFLDSRCFPSSTPIQIEHGMITAIAAIKVGDTVLSFDPAADFGRGALVPKRVTRLYRNTTTEWVRLAWVEDGAARELIATPGHYMLDQYGQFPRLDAMISAGCATVVLATGALAEVMAERIIYSAATSHLFERAYATATVGNVALKPEPMDAWATYNFEVEDLHTYIAGGVRVHNASGFLGRLGDFLFSAGLDGSGVRDRFENEGFWDTVGDGLSNFFHAAGELVGEVVEGVGNFARAVAGTVNQVFEAIFGPGGNSNSFEHTERTSWTDTDGRPHWGSLAAFERAVSKGKVDSVGTDSNGRDSTGPCTGDGAIVEPGVCEAPDDLNLKPILLDLDGTGISITERGNSSLYFDGGDGLQHPTAWAGAGDGVLFFDAGMDGKITEKREYVFTEWTQGSTSDLEAVREAFDTNGDGRLTSADAQWGSFKVMVTNPDGTVVAKTLSQLRITEIDLRPDATHIELLSENSMDKPTELNRKIESNWLASSLQTSCLQYYLSHDSLDQQSSNYNIHARSLYLGIDA